MFIKRDISPAYIKIYNLPAAKISAVPEENHAPDGFLLIAIATSFSSSSKIALTESFIFSLSVSVNLTIEFI